MSIDNLLSCQVVTADGKVLTASASENEDLFWALRGGGGNFGVVTSFEFRAHPVHTVLGGLLLYPREAAVDVIRHFRGYMESAPDELTAYAALLHRPDGAPFVGVIPCYCGGIVEGQRVLEPLRTFGSPVVDAIQRMPFPAMQSLLAPSFPDGMPCPAVAGAGGGRHHQLFDLPADDTLLVIEPPVGHRWVLAAGSATANADALVTTACLVTPIVTAASTLTYQEVAKRPSLGLRGPAVGALLALDVER